MSELPLQAGAALSTAATDDASTANRPSPFEGRNQTIHATRHLDSGAHDDDDRFGAGLFIARTRSLDETRATPQHWHRHLRQQQHPHHSGDYDEYFMEDEDLCSDEHGASSTTLHSSFDASLLRGEKTLLEEVEDGSVSPVRDVLPVEQDFGLSGKEHFLRASSIAESPRINSNFNIRSALETSIPGTVRKQSTKARRITNEHPDLPKTPGRLMNYPVGYGATTDSTKPLFNSPPPSSAVKRRRAASSQHPRPSPMRRVPPSGTALAHAGTHLSLSASILSPIAGNTHPQQMTPVPLSTVLGSTGATCHVASSASSLYHFHTFTDPSPLSSEHPPAMTPTFPVSTKSNYSTAGAGRSGTVKKMPYYTGTTAGTTPGGTTFETDSVETSSPARFRFTSFPASLPRINNLRTRDRQCPNSVRKRMSFGAEATTTTNCRDDSNYAETVTDGAPVNQSCEANQSRDDEGTNNTSISSLSAEGGHHHHLPEAPSATSHLAGQSMMGNFPPYQVGRDLYGEDKDHFGYSDDEDEGEDNDGGVDGDKKRGAAGRTRLDFNVFVSPRHKDGGGNNDARNPLEVGSTLLRPLDLNLELSRAYDQRRINSFPSSISSTTQMNISSCDDNGASSTPPRHDEKCSRPSTPREVQLRFPIESECSPIPAVKDDPIHVAMERNLESSSESSSVLVGDKLMPTKSSISVSGLSICHPQKNARKEEGSTTSESTNARQRRLRPMPEISAFESAAASSRVDRSADDSATADSRGISSTNRLLCPPTPQRTPAWANEGGAHAFFTHRQNSLITTKVLLACPSQVLEGRSSLENSLLDDESKARDASNRKPSRTKIPPHQSESNTMDIEQNHASADVDQSTVSVVTKAARNQISAPPRLTRRLPSGRKNEAVISFADDFEVLSILGSGAFADVYKVRFVGDGRLYAVKRNRRQFRGKRDRIMALAEVQSMQRLQNVCADTHCRKATDCGSEKTSYSLFILFFYRAWQEEGYFYSQTELCCRDTCREMLDSIRFLWSTAKTRYPSLRRNLLFLGSGNSASTNDLHGTARLVPNLTVWKICHDVSAGLSHIHSHNIAHGDLKPSNVFLVSHPRFGAMCKIGDFGMAGNIGSSGDGQEGDARYMSSELLASATRRASSDIFSLGLTLYEIAADDYTEIPSEGPRWHLLRSVDQPRLPRCRDDELQKLVQSMTNPNESTRPTADEILEHRNVKPAGLGVDVFLKEYIRDVEDFDRREEQRMAMDQTEDQTPRNGQRSARVRSPSLSMLLAPIPNLLSPTVVNP